jgi:hypothetical protein
VTCTVTLSNAAGPGSCEAGVDLQPYKPTSVTLTINPGVAGLDTPVTVSWSGNNTPTSYTLIQTVPGGETRHRAREPRYLPAKARAVTSRSRM